ncbi:deoxynucleoside kinase [Apilactobacillus micheneri]|uniref:Deoxynucleoside kinase n=1 Tax=Apilactobacillus timberlakei TaxID=2008380 RepID=A0ABY2YU25_9LACO|nr:MULTISPECIES: deoxynucleoside kinase [Apilactobacillus]TPR14476.1 deoxynucleoside kinase [Apilactobacillus timberlakei]TPR14645.1 deoxynucleoside kinase [Apilactobacillus timberlakei]TPR15972.1 deoxynucleoside kinase [Apilactobacillus timberlakei]TPR36973.1 deoxynucleoside kinase [Apilactobacillus micheneri]TPR39515.1 deoxynucleoside kinase [Apilactobacillus micheneri]
MLVLAGTIGAGKTSLTRLLSEHLDSTGYYESVDDNEILPLFYKDPKRYAFLLQIYFLNTRFENLEQAQSEKLSVMDRSIYEDSLMFRLNADMNRATETEADIYDSLLENMMEEIPNSSLQKNPDLLIHINISFDTMLKRIKKRGRSFEQVDNDPGLYDYYQDLNDRYNNFYKNYDQSPKIQIDGDKYDFIENENDRKKVLQQIDNKLKELNLK